MTNEAEKLLRLQEKLEALSKRHDAFSTEINALREEIQTLQRPQSEQQPGLVKEEETRFTTETSDTYAEDEFVKSLVLEKTDKSSVGPPEIPLNPSTKPPKIKSDVEHFIGSNIINKIGIAITIIGVAIGAQYSIEHDLISPITRICLGYLIGIGLLGFGVKLKKAYTDFSAVLVSGAIAIMYFITYAAYSFYGLFPQVVAFALMVLFTGLTIAAAMNYNRQVIAHIGLVGAYAVPFLLNNDEGDVAVLYAYMAIINIGILIIAVRKYWKPLYYSSFILTWLIFVLWHVFQYEDSNQYNVFRIFSFIFFITFYLIFISYKLLHREKFQATDVMLILSNSFIFYGLGYSALTNHNDGTQLLGLFTIANAVIHLCVSLFVYTQKAADRSLLSMIAGLVLVFITIAIPVQLDGSWVTLLWAGEAALLFWIGRLRNDSTYEKISYALIFLAFFSIIGDWMMVYNQYDPELASTRIRPLLNIHFLTSLLLITSFSFIAYLNSNSHEPLPGLQAATTKSIMQLAIPTILLFTMYFALRIEITTYWDQLYLDSSYDSIVEGTDYPTTYYNENIPWFKEIWALNYSILFFSLLAFINWRFIRNKRLARVVIGFGFICIVAFLSQGLLVLNQLRDCFLYLDASSHYVAGSFNMTIRYITYAFAVLMLFVLYRTIQKEDMDAQKRKLIIAFDLLFHLSLVIVLSNEWITWMSFLQYSESTRLGLSILWGMYALLLIILGIWKNKRHLRIGAIVLFAVTLVKLALYDISHLDTIAKTIIFVSLGILLLVISFLYNKYKHLTHPE